MECQFCWLNRAVSYHSGFTEEGFVKSTVKLEMVEKQPTGITIGSAVYQR